MDWSYLAPSRVKQFGYPLVVAIFYEGYARSSTRADNTNGTNRSDA